MNDSREWKEPAMPKATISLPGGRTYIERLRRDPRTRAMRDGWIAQATYEAEQRYPHAMDGRKLGAFAAERAIELAMSFVLDNDGELAATREQLDKVLEQSITALHLQPVSMIIPKGES